MGDALGFFFRLLANWDQCYRRRARCWSAYQHGQPLNSCRPANTRSSRTSHQFHQPVEPAASHYGALGTQAWRDELKRRVGVVIKATHEPFIYFDSSHIGSVQPLQHRIKKFLRLGVAGFRHLGCTVDYLVVALVLGIQNA